MQNNATSTPKVKYVWHFVWSKIFHLFHIDVRNIFLRAYIIHFTQTIISFAVLFYFSKVSIRNLFKTIDTLHINYLAYWTTLIWFTIFSTFSGIYHQVWILWYSINYQISLPFTLFITGLAITLSFESMSLKKKIISVILILFFSYIILRIHAMEYIYFLMYLSVLMFLFLDKIFLWWKNNLYLSIPFTVIIFFVLMKFIPYLNTFAYRKSPIFNYISFEKLPQFLEQLDLKGTLFITHYSRASTTINELIYLSLFSISTMLIIVIYRHYKKYNSYVNIRMVIFLFITSMFIMIPLTKITAGLISLMTYSTISYRFYFSSLLFLTIPSFVFYLFSLFKIKRLYILNLSIFLIILNTFLYSKYISSTHNYYKNIMSIKNSFDKEKMRFNLSNKEILLIGEKIKFYERNISSKKEIFYYARDDIAFILKFIYRKPVLYYRRGTKNYFKSYTMHKDKAYYPVLFKVPEGFPDYERYK